MGRTKRVLIGAGILVFSLACMAINFPEEFTIFATATASPEPELPVATATRPPFPTLTPPPTATAPYPSAPPVADWIEKFSDPILKALEDQRPAFQDAFSRGNQGWFIFNPQNRARPLYADVRDGALYLEFEDTPVRKDLIVYNQRMIREDFVLSFDFKFGKTDPNDFLRFQFAETARQVTFVDLSKNENWTFFWNLHSNFQSSNGSYDYFSPEYLNVLIIMHGEECALLLNHHPADYSSTCRSEPIERLSRYSMTFHLFSFRSTIQSHPVQVIIDNVKVWDLEKISGLP